MKLNPLTITLGAALVASACDRPPVVRHCDVDGAVRCPNLTGPQGRIEGTIIYQGPPPLYRSGQPGVASGRVLLLLFEYDNPPPPQGTATTAISFQSVSAADLFRNATALPDGNVQATIPYVFPNIPRAGVYQIRAFYSRNETIEATVDGTPRQIPSGFHPLYGVRNLPVRGDVGGGAIVDPMAAIPRFRPIVVGTQVGVDERGRPRYELPESGAVVHGVTVYMGQVFRTDRPVFSVVTDTTGDAAPRRMGIDTVGVPPGLREDAPAEVPPPSPALVEYAWRTGLVVPGSPVLTMVRNPVVMDANAGSDVPQFVARFSLPPSECEVAALAGVACPEVNPMNGFLEMALDLNENGRIDLTRDSLFADAHPTLITNNPLAMPTSGRLPWIYPLVILSKLHDPTPEEELILREGQNGRIPLEVYQRVRSSLNHAEGLDPAHNRYPVLLFGAVLPNDNAANLLLRPWASGYRQLETTLRVAIIPIAVEVHGTDQRNEWYGIIPPGVADVIGAAAPFLPPTFRCDQPNLELPVDDPAQPTGIPTGRYAVNFLGPGGQAWTTPNELAGFVTPNAPASVCPNSVHIDENHTMPVCIAPSQGLVVRIEGLDPNTPANTVCPNADTSPMAPRTVSTSSCRGEWCERGQWPRRPN